MTYFLYCVGIFHPSTCPDLFELWVRWTFEPYLSSPRYPLVQGGDSATQSSAEGVCVEEHALGGRARAQHRLRHEDHHEFYRGILCGAVLVFHGLRFDPFFGGGDRREMGT